METTINKEILKTNIEDLIEDGVGLFVYATKDLSATKAIESKKLIGQYINVLATDEESAVYSALEEIAAFVDTIESDSKNNNTGALDNLFISSSMLITIKDLYIGDKLEATTKFNLIAKSDVPLFVDAAQKPITVDVPKETLRSLTKSTLKSVANSYLEKYSGVFR